MTLAKPNRNLISNQMFLAKKKVVRHNVTVTVSVIELLKYVAL